MLAIGNPFGVGQTVTMGIVSAMGRTNLGIEDYEDFIQTDAPINPGNSGGALVNDRGELIGINTAILSHGSEGNQGIGFAVPVNLARTVMDELLKDCQVIRAYLGIVPQDFTPAMARAFNNAKLEHGSLVGDVTAGSPAEKAGLKRGDVIVNVNGKPVMGANDLRMTTSADDAARRLREVAGREGPRRRIPGNDRESRGAAWGAGARERRQRQIRQQSFRHVGADAERRYGATVGCSRRARRAWW